MRTSLLQAWPTPPHGRWLCPMLSSGGDGSGDIETAVEVVRPRAEDMPENMTADLGVISKKRRLSSPTPSPSTQQEEAEVDDLFHGLFRAFSKQGGK